jgi:DNA adenine methylase
VRYVSPLRYPGGKASLSPYLVNLLEAQRPRPSIYIEPFAGGAGAALHLLVDEHVDQIVINDLNPGIAAFWRCVFTRPDELCEMIRVTAVDIDTWHEQGRIYADAATQTELALGFATFYLNRTNHSGILNARPIGGLSQKGRWKIDARFNRNDLITRIHLLGRYGDRVTVRQEDAVDFLTEAGSALGRCFLYVDPPYLGQGPDLYLDTMSWDDHKLLAAALQDRHRLWMLTYDIDTRVIDELYPGHRSAWFDIAHTAARQHVGREYAVYSRHLRVKTLEGMSTGETGWIELTS